MATLQEQLASRFNLKLSETKKEEIRPTVRSVHGSAKFMDDLSLCETPRQFREATRAILLRDVQRAPELIGEIVRLAHAFRDSHPECFSNLHENEAERFAWFFLGVRDQIQKAKPEELETIIGRAFSKSAVKTMRRLAKRN